MRIAMWMALGAATLAGCNQAGDAPAGDNGAANAAANTAAAEKKRPAYCFFKDAETKGWAAKRDAGGNVVVTGKAYRSDARYKAELGEAEIEGTTARLRPTITTNTGYAAPENWWDVSKTIPNSTGVTSVVVECGKKTLATLQVR